MTGLGIADFEKGPRNPLAPPTALEIRQMGRLGLGFGRDARISLMNVIGAAVRIPPGGFGGQARLVVKGDLRLVGLLALMTHEQASHNIATNLARAGRLTETSVLLTLVTAAREHASALTATSDKMIDSWREGGLDFLWKNRNQLGLPRSVTESWAPVPPFNSWETHNPVFPAYIPARDQTVVYAAQIQSSFERNFKAHLREEIGATAADMSLSNSTRVARMMWQVYAFLAPGGSPFDPKRPLGAQLGRGFGSQTALSYVIHNARATDQNAQVNLDLVFQDSALNATEWVQSAKTRVAETLFLERLMTTVRELKSADD